MNELKAGSYQMDQLKEIVNIGASHASTALSQMINREVEVAVPDIVIDKIENLGRVVTVPEAKVTAIELNILGDIEGIMIFMFAEDYALKLSNLLTKKGKEATFLGEMEISAIKEVGNILVGSSLSAFSKFLDMNLVHSVSNIAIDTKDAVINSLAVEIGRSTDEVLVLNVSFRVPSVSLESNMYFFIDSGASAKILEAVNKKYPS